MIKSASKVAQITSANRGAQPSESTATNETLLVGLDWGTNTSCLMASPLGSPDLA